MVTSTCNKCNTKTIFSWVNSIGHALIEYVELYIGGTRIDRHTGEWLYINSELKTETAKKQAYNSMIGGKNVKIYSRIRSVNLSGTFFLHLLL